jgi:D-xylose 1-dehydrogenase (NADP+, D-xylono-1,5-lactone-forming)
MTDKLGWGLLSTAHINRRLIPVIKSSPHSRLVAVASRDPATADAYARQWGIGRAHGSYEALLADPEINIVYISLPNHLHAEWAIRALTAGKHVLCEKPLALSLGEIDAMTAAARQTGRVLAEAFMYRHHPQTLRVQEIVDSGALGTIRLLKGAFTFTLQRPHDIRLRSETGGGSIWDAGCYPISYTRLITGSEPREAFGWQVVGPGGVDETFVGALRFPGDMHAQFDCGFRAAPRSYIEVVGSEAALIIPVPFTPHRDERIHLRRGDAIETIEIAGGELYEGEVNDIADAARFGKPPRISLEDSRGNVAAILGLLEAARTGKPATI